MGFDFGDVWNPLEQFKDLANKGSGAVGGGGGNGDAGTYATVRGANGQPTLAPTTYGQRLSQQTGLVAPVTVSDGTRQALLAQQGGIAGQFASGMENSYQNYGARGNASLDALQAQAQGRNSVSAEQLRQAQQGNQAAQMSMAAGASPQNSGMAARTAAMQMGRSNAGLAGQQAVAGLQERNQAQQSYSNLLQGLRGQDLNAALTSRQNAESGYGAGMTGAPQKGWMETYGPAIVGGVSAVASDKRLKKDITDGDKSAAKMLSGLKAYAYSYKDSKHGEGKYTGPMAQDLEKAGSRAVVNTPGGKMVHGARLATELAAMMPGLAKRLSALEGRK